MAIIDRPVPTLRGKDAERMMRMIKRAETVERGTIDYSDYYPAYLEILRKSRLNNKS